VSDIVEAVRKVMTDNAAISALFSTRIYPGKLNLGKQLPAVFYQVVSEVLEDESGIKTCRIQVTNVATTYLAARTNATVICGDTTGEIAPTGLHGYKGTKLGVRIKSISFMNKTEDDDGEATAVASVYFVNTDYQVVFR